MAENLNTQKDLLSSASFSAEDILSYLMQNGKIDLDGTEEDMKKSQMDKILDQHPYKIYQGSNGKWYTYISDDSKKHKRRKIERTSEEDLKHALYEYYTGAAELNKLDTITIEKLFPKWIEYKSFHTSASTYITRLKSDWRTFYEGTPIVKIPIRRLKKLDLDEWAHRLIRERELTQKAFVNIATIVNQVLEYAVDLEIIENNPFSKVKIDNKHLFKPVKKKESKNEVYSKEEERKLKKMAWSDFENRVKVYVLSPLAVLFQFETGVRIGELVALRYEDVEGDYITVQRMYRRDSKEVVPYTKGTFGDRRVILTSEAKRIIETCRKFQEENNYDSGGYIFSINGMPCSYGAVNDLYRKYCKNMGIVRKTSHKARKTYISSLIDGNVNVNSVREMAGHRDERTTFANYYYDRSTDEEKLKQVEAALAC